MCEINKKDAEQVALLGDILVETLTKGFVKEMRENRLKDKDPDANNFFIKITSLVLDLPEMEAPQVMEEVGKLHEGEESVIFFMRSIVGLYMLKEKVVIDRAEQQ